MFAQTSLRRRFVVLAMAFVMLGVFVPVNPAVAATDACPSTIPSAGYRDLAGFSSETIEAINCITYYGISEGVTTTLFDPAGEVPRWQMALFLHRAAEAIRIGLPLVTASPFDDVDALPPEIRLAIDQLAAAGIVNGTTPSTFEPMSGVPRWQMAVFLERLLSRAGIRVPSDGARFTDLAAVPDEAVAAISALDSIGIARGLGDGRFDHLPIGWVAAFYALMGVVRLIYFTLDNTPIPGFFKGLPTPAAWLMRILRWSWVT